MKQQLGLIVLIASLAVSLACRETPDSTPDDVVDAAAPSDAEDPGDVQQQELTGNERWIQPSGTAKITFFVDDTANQTFEDGEIVWTGSFSWNKDDNTLVYATSWLPTDGPYPLLYDDGPVSDGGHEMAGSEAGDHIFSTEVYFKADEDAVLDYGVLNELGFWMWEGTNGRIEIPAGSTKTYEAEGLTLKPFGTIDLKLIVDVTALNPEFGYVEEWGAPNVYLKGSLNMWTPVQILDMGPDINKGDEVADDGVYTYVQGLNLGKHTGLLFDGQHAQFTFMFAKAEETYETGVEYKLLTEGTQKGVKDGITAYIDCVGDGSWVEADIVWETDSWGSTDNTAVVADCGGEPPKPDCTEDDDTCPEGQKCVNEKCVDWCDLDEECAEGEKCVDNECKVWCDLDEECGEGEKCVDNECKVWCDLDEDCADGFICVDNKCEEDVVVSEPMVSSIDPDSGPTEGGTLVLISGQVFQDGAAVTFDGTAAGSIVVLSATEIECTTPAHGAGKVDVEVTNPDSGSDTFIKGFSYIEEAQAPVIDSIDPTQGSVAGGTEVQIYGSNFLPDPTVLFGSSLATPVTFVDSGLVIATTPSGSLGAVDVTLMNSDSQEATLPQSFTYVPNAVDYVKLLAPISVTSLAGQPAETIHAEVWEPGITDGAGAGSGLKAEFGYGEVVLDLENDPSQWTWEPAVYDGESGNNDVWKGNMSSPDAGKYRFTFRFSMDGVNWVYADADGSSNGFSMAEAGEWEVKELGDGPVIFTVEPKAGTVLGGTTLTVTGVGFDAGMASSFAGGAVEITDINETSFKLVTPAHEAGPVNLMVETPDGKADVKQDAFRYVYEFTATVDGDLSEWDPAFMVAINDIESNWDPDINGIAYLYVGFDQNLLYIGIEGDVEAANYILGYLDVDFPLATGPADMSTLADNDASGDLDDALSNVLNVLVDGFGADFAFGSQGMTSYSAGGDLGDSKFVGWRELSPTDDFGWLQGAVVCGDQALEASISLGTLFGNGVQDGAKSLALFAKLANKYGGFDGISNQTLPEYYDADAPEAVGEVVVIDVVF